MSIAKTSFLRRNHRGIKGSIALLAAFAIIGAWLGKPAYRLYTYPSTVIIPSPKMPSPNAFVDYVAAESDLVDKKKILELSPRDPADPRDAAWETNAQILLEKNRLALHRLRRGLQREYQEPRPVYGQETPYLRDFNTLAGLLRLEAAFHGDQKRWHEAADSSLDAMLLGTSIPRGGDLLGFLTGSSCGGVGRQWLWYLLPKLNSQDARSALIRMEKIEAVSSPLTETLENEKWRFQAFLLDSLSHPVQIVEELTHVTAESPNGTDSHFRMPITAPFDLRRILRDYTAYMDRLIANSRKPFSQRIPAAKISGEAVVKMISVWQDNLSFVETEIYAQNRLLTAALALQAYHQDRGEYPPSLEALSPSYLKSLPVDPFGRGEAFRYRRQGSDYVLYSIGPDGTDEGGRPVEEKAANGKKNDSSRHRVKEHSSGDVVASINF